MTAGPPAPAAPHCYRHPDRETYIRCTRCERPICPDCMTSAAVGFQCPECVAAGRASTPDIRTPAGGVATERPVVTIAIVIVCVLVYAVQYLALIPEVVARFSMWPVAIALDGQFYRLVTAAFLHGSVLHIAFNMFVLWTLGPTLERILGPARFLVLYLLAALGGSVASYVFSDPLTQSVGASGAIFGLMGALVVAGRRLGFDVTQVLVLIGINVVIGFLPGGNIDWRAHLGGLVTGAVVAAVMVHAPRQSRTLWQALGCLAVLGLLVVVTIWRTAALRSQLAPIYGPILDQLTGAAGAGGLVVHHVLIALLGG